MYNRYVPQADGSYRRSRVPENNAPPHRPPPPPVGNPPPEPEPTHQVPPPPPRQPEYHPLRQEKRAEPQSGNIMGFLRQLLPKDFDTGDLFVVLLLLLMSENSKEGQNTALLTLVIYLFL